MGAIISRFAPAPTGFLHLGHIVNAAYVWRETRARQGRVLLRIEDHDRQRSRPEFEAAILDDLAWLGFAADEPLVRQSERGAIYEDALDRLRARGLVYACSCSRADIVNAIDRRALERNPVVDRRGRPLRRPAPAGPEGQALPLQGARAFSASGREPRERTTVDAPKRLWREG